MATIYTGRVGARLRAPVARRRIARTPRTRIALHGGPLDGAVVRLCAPDTLPINLHGQTGHYRGSHWVAATT